MTTTVTLAAFPNLSGHQFMSLTTYRKSGDAVPTPVWFAESDGKLYVTTQTQAGKAKRIRHTPSVTVAPCTVSGEVLGPAALGAARVLPPEEFGPAAQALQTKYGQQYTDITSRSPSAHRIFIEITPAS